MSIYLPNVTDYVPQIQPFRPDYNFYAGALQMKQGQYDQSYNQLSSVYGTLLNSPMLRDVNNQRRDNFFKSADENIKKVAGLDLSKQENVDAAMTIFKPFYTDKNMVKDMTWTKQYQGELNRADNFRNCIDPDKCGGAYWEGGVKALNYKADEFKNSSDDEALSTAAPNFTPFINVTQKALKAAKDAGFNIQVDTLQGGYIVTTKNGNLLLGTTDSSGVYNAGPLETFFTSLFGNDPKVMDVFKTQAYLQRKDFAYGNATQYGGKLQAEAAYVQQIMAKTLPEIEKGANQAIDSHDKLVTKKQAIDNSIKENGMIINSPEHLSYSDFIDQMSMSEQSKTFHEEALNTVKSTTNLNNISAMNDRIDQIVAYGLFSKEIQTAAQTFAYKDYSVTMKADEFAVNAQEHAFRMQEIGYKASLDAAAEAKKKEEEDAKAIGTLDENNPVVNPNIAGTVTDGEDETEQTSAINSAKMAEVRQAQEASSSTEASFLKDFATTLQAEYSVAKQPGTKDGGMRQAMLLESAAAVFKGTGIDPKAVLNGTADLTKIDKYSTASKRSLYQKAVTVSDPKTPLNGVNDFWTGSFWEKSAESRQQINTSNKITDAYSSFITDQSFATTKAMMNKYTSPEDKNLASVLTDKTGNVIPKDAFIKAYVTKYTSTYQPISTKTGGLQPNQLSWKGGNGPVSYNTIGAATQAENAAANKYDNLVEDYAKTYSSTAKAWNGLGTNGNNGKGGGSESAAFTINVDPKNYKSLGAQQFGSLANNIDALKGSAEMSIAYGDASTIRDNDESASAILNTLISDYRLSIGSKNTKRPFFTMVYQDIAGGDPNMTAAIIYPSETWAKQYKTKTGIIQSNDYLKGISVFIPKDKANNAAHNSLAYTTERFLLEQTGSLTVDTHPDAGNITISKQGEGYTATGTRKQINPQTGKTETVPVSAVYNTLIDPSQIYAIWDQQLGEISSSLTQYNTALKSVYGIKDPTKIPVVSQ